jgi:small subunit ribosomal protein S12
MSTFSQLIHKPRKKWKRKNKHFLWQEGRPFTAVKALILKDKPVVQIMTPRKPNSAKRKYVRVGWFRPKHFGSRLTQWRTNAYVPGEIKGTDFQPQGNADLLIRGGRVKDLPGMKYTIVRGYKKSLKGLSYRRTSRSKYGTPYWYVSEEQRATMVYKKFKYQ